MVQLNCSRKFLTEAYYPISDFFSRKQTLFIFHFSMICLRACQNDMSLCVPDVSFSTYQLSISMLAYLLSDSFRTSSKENEIGVENDFPTLSRVNSVVSVDGSSHTLCISEACTRAGITSRITHLFHDCLDKHKYNDFPANGILEAMDQSIDPCQGTEPVYPTAEFHSREPRFSDYTDFYAYACGGWLKKNVIPEDKSRYSVFSHAKEKLELTVKRTLNVVICCSVVCRSSTRQERFWHSQRKFHNAGI